MTDRWPGGDEPTYRISELGAELRELLSEVYASVWVAGEVHRMRPSRNGHLYFELVEKGAGDAIVGKIDAVLWRTDHLRVNRLLRGSDQRLREGMEIRCRAQLDYYPPAGRVQLVVRDVDPTFALGRLAVRRRQTLAALERAGLLERNRARALDPVPLSVLLVTSAGSAAYHDFLSGLAGSGYGFQVRVLDTAVQGAQAERALAASLAGIDRLLAHPGARPQVVAVVRGGGARTDLAVFDSRAVAEAVARCPLPVIVGLGHQIDRTVVDRVCHASFKTPTACASFLVDRAAAAEQTVVDLQAAISERALWRLRGAIEALHRIDRLAPAALRCLESARRQVRAAGRGLDLASRRRCRGAAQAVDALGRRLRAAAPRSLGRRRLAAPRLARRLLDRARGRLSTATATVDGLARVCAELAPDRVLARGFSITRDAHGTLVRSPGQLAIGDRLLTQVAGGRIKSDVAAEEES